MDGNKKEIQTTLQTKRNRLFIMIAVFYSLFLVEIVMFLSISYDASTNKDLFFTNGSGLLKKDL